MALPYWPIANVSTFYQPQGLCAQNTERPGGYFHTGIDIPAPIGTSVFATHNGAVQVFHSNGYAGNSIFLHIDSGHTVAYFHLDRIMVADGTSVTAGAQIGTVGETGESLAPHLHISINTDKLRETNNIDVFWWLKTGEIRGLK